MPGRLSNKDRIAKAAAEAAATKKAKTSKKKAAKKTAKKKTTRKKAAKKTSAKSAGRLKLVWVVCDHSGSGVKTFSHTEEAVARKEAKRLTEDKGKTHFVKKEKIPME